MVKDYYNKIESGDVSMKEVADVISFGWKKSGVVKPGMSKDEVLKLMSKQIKEQEDDFFKGGGAIGKAISNFFVVDVFGQEDPYTPEGRLANQMKLNLIKMENGRYVDYSKAPNIDQLANSGMLDIFLRDVEMVGTFAQAFGPGAAANVTRAEELGLTSNSIDDLLYADSLPSSRSSTASIREGIERLNINVPRPPPPPPAIGLYPLRPLDVTINRIGL